MKNKCKEIYYLMYKLYQGEELTVNDHLAAELSINKRTLSRYLEDIVLHFSDVLIVEKKRSIGHERQAKVYRLVKHNEDLAKALSAFFERKSDLTWILQLLHEKDSLLFQDEGIERDLKKIVEEESEIFVFKSKPFEILNEQQQKIFSMLKRAVKNHQYKTIHYKYDVLEILEDVKCLKLLFIQENWYLAVEDKDGKFRLLRIAFIEQVLQSDRSTYQARKVEKYDAFYQSMQNAMSLEGAPLQKAIIVVSPKVSKYFKSNMKSFFTSQRFIKENSDGSVEFELRYTQPIEILPFIKRWLPDLTIVSPQSLKDVLHKDLENAMKNLVK